MFIVTFGHVSIASNDFEGCVSPRTNPQVDSLSYFLISSYDVSPDGMYVVISGRTGIYLFDALTLEYERTLACPANPLITVVRWSPDGTRIAAYTSLEEAIQIYDVTTGNVVARFGTQFYVGEEMFGVTGVFAMAWSPDSRQLAAIGSGFPLTIWDIETQRPIFETDLQATTPYRILSWSRNGYFLALAYGSHVMVWQTDPFQFHYTFEWEQGVGAFAWVSWSAQNQLAISGYGGYLQIHDLNTNEQIIPSVFRAQAVSWNPDAIQLAFVGYRDTISRPRPVLQILNVATGEIEQTLSGHELPPFDILWHPDGRHLYSMSAINSEDGSARQLILWDTVIGSIVAQISPHIESQ